MTHVSLLSAVELELEAVFVTQVLFDHHKGIGLPARQSSDQTTNSDYS